VKLSFNIIKEKCQQKNIPDQISNKVIPVLKISVNKKLHKQPSDKDT